MKGKWLYAEFNIKLMPSRTSNSLHPINILIIFFKLKNASSKDVS